ncbi:hypothetical protein OQ486_16230 [Plesiomonas shigelloides]|uniref:hypothetical protein n=1 Tax=Plesiomonas shigelloides TaxID=703 RepID=UPI002246D001|nr:hypothetical protein [Plesiomonas shigelloides]MCX2534993.1 hypothetical protein [Plesiomonas shigelloides]
MQTAICTTAIQIVSGVPVCDGGFQIIDTVVSNPATLGAAFSAGFFAVGGIVLVGRLVNVVVRVFDER